MKNQYQKLTPPPRPSNPTPLELAIHRYEQDCAKFHNKRNSTLPEDSTKNIEYQEAARQDWQHLKVLRKQIVARVYLQNQLSEYRYSTQKASDDGDLESLYNEEHHPTDRLAPNLTAIGEPKPTTNHEPHHIIPGKGRYRQDELMNVRLNLHAYGYGINDPLNGVWLVNFKKNKPLNWDSPKSPGHREIHRYNYETWIISKFMLDTLPKEVFTNRLIDVKSRLRTGSHPAQILIAKDTKWTDK
ncbi:AHH domain-containing protein [Vibrio penaeicida]|uniref:HNH endonuclease n=1 Tax=Vibrio penaeicida TaxID=104609 RepID=A0AAV5NQE6_9VIBR|nr:AHH domain-containing protein [Vibrio penaeicida]RTZ21733.1 hypothetical protein EKN09_17625 [Vibrio penaeicida]GLQ72896.1 hypothetical protein GCM10007932_22560 [Vibrio penaeicida]